MKQMRMVVLLSLLLPSVALMGQEEQLAERLGASRGRNVAYVSDMRVDTCFTINAILIQSYSDADWHALLGTMGKSPEWLCGNGGSQNVVFWVANKHSLLESDNEELYDDDCFVFCRCSERTVAIFFPRGPTEQDKILSSVLTKGQVELHLFAQRYRKSHKTPTP